MNTNEPIHNRNAETAPRLRFNNDQILPNHIVYPYHFHMPQLFYPLTQSVIMAANHSQPPNIHTNDHNSEHSGIMSPNSDTSVGQPPYRISNWQDIVDSYEGNEDRPKCGKLKDNVYFTQRSATSDVYMLFDRKSDYINNFVNYYFSDKNLARDQKLVALMDEKGIVPLSALKKFPKLQQVDTTVEDLMKAFQYNNFVAVVDIANNEKGAQRRDRMYNADINKNGMDKLPFSDQTPNESSSNNQMSVVSSVSDLNMSTIQSNDQVSSQNTSYYVYNPPTLVPTIYSQQAGIMPTAPAINGLQSYNPFIMTQFPYGTHSAPTQVGLNPSQNHLYPSSLLFPVGNSQDFNSHATLISHIPYNTPGASSNHVINHNNARFLSSSANGANFNSSVQTTAATSEPTGNRLN